MPCQRKYVRVRAKDVGRPGHHYIKIGVKRKKGPRGGQTEKIGRLRKYKSSKKSRSKKRKRRRKKRRR